MKNLKDIRSAFYEGRKSMQSECLNILKAYYLNDNSQGDFLILSIIDKINNIDKIKESGVIVEEDDGYPE